MKSKKWLEDLLERLRIQLGEPYQVETVKKEREPKTRAVFISAS